MSSGSRSERNEGRDDAVLDASAILALLLEEPGSGVVEAHLPGLVSAVNLAEVYYKAAQKGLAIADARAVLSELPFTVVPFDESQALVAGELHSRTRRLGLSLGDCACLALGITERRLVLTTEGRWAEVPLPPTTTVLVIR